MLDYDAASGRTRTGSAERIVGAVLERGLEVAWILGTHAHADHLSAATRLQRRLGGRIGIGARITEVQRTFEEIFDLEAGFATDGRRFDRLFEDGERFAIGRQEAIVLHTPGHTPACCTYLVGDCAFVGDTLFMPDGGTARADFPGGDAARLYRAIARILALPPETRLLVCHDYQPGGREPRFVATVAEQRARNIHVGGGRSEAEFVALRTARDRTLAMPALLIPSIPVDIRAGELPPPEDNGVSYLEVPIDRLRAAPPAFPRRRTGVPCPIVRRGTARGPVGRCTMLRSSGMAGSALLTPTLAFGSPPPAAAPRATVGGDPNPAPAAAVAPIRLDDDRRDRITAGHTRLRHLDRTRTPPAVAEVEVILGSSVSAPPNTGWLGIEWRSTALPINASGAANLLHRIGPCADGGVAAGGDAMRTGGSHRRSGRASGRSERTAGRPRSVAPDASPSPGRSRAPRSARPLVTRSNRGGRLVSPEMPAIERDPPAWRAGPITSFRAPCPGPAVAGSLGRACVTAPVGRVGDARAAG